MCRKVKHIETGFQVRHEPSQACVRAQALLVTHQPRWLSDWLHEEAGCHNLRTLVRGHLRGRARVHLAGTAP